MIDCYREGMNRIKFNDHFAAIRCILMILIISISTPLRADEPACPEPTREAFIAIDQAWPNQVISIRWHEQNMIEIGLMLYSGATGHSCGINSA